MHVSPVGELALLHPTPGEDNRIAAGAPFRVPAEGREDFAIEGPFGNHRLKVLVTERPLILTGLDQRAPRPADDAEGNKGLGSPEGGRSPEPWRGYAFRFFPTQDRQIKSLLTDYVHDKPIDAERLDRIDVSRVLSSFAQDEITYYVGPGD
jgi:hypothetical protein